LKVKTHKLNGELFQIKFLTFNFKEWSQRTLLKSRPIAKLPTSVFLENQTRVTDRKSLMRTEETLSNPVMIIRFSLMMMKKTYQNKKASENTINQIQKWANQHSFSQRISVRSMGVAKELKSTLQR